MNFLEFLEQFFGTTNNVSALRRACRCVVLPHKDAVIVVVVVVVVVASAVAENTFSRQNNKNSHFLKHEWLKP